MNTDPQLPDNILEGDNFDWEAPLPVGLELEITLPGIEDREGRSSSRSTIRFSTNEEGHTAAETVDHAIRVANIRKEGIFGELSLEALALRVYAHLHDREDLLDSEQKAYEYAYDPATETKNNALNAFLSAVLFRKNKESLRSQIQPHVKS